MASAFACALGAERSGQTPLDLARGHGHAEVVRLLEDAEAWLMRRTEVPPICQQDRLGEFEPYG